MSRCRSISVLIVRNVVEVASNLAGVGVHIEPESLSRLQEGTRVCVQPELVDVNRSQQGYC